MNQVKEKITFTREDTVMIKGVAILLLLLHHMGGTNPGIPLSLKGLDIGIAIEHLGKVCVALFTVLSGYGLSEGSKKHQKKYPYVLRHIKKVWLGFISAWLLTLILNWIQGITPQQFYGTGIQGVYFMIKDALGLQNFLVVTPTICGLYWYIECIFVCYLLFPILNFLMDKLKKADILLLILTFVPWIYYLIKQDYMMHTDRELFYLFAFCVGMYLSKHHILNRLKENCKKPWAVIVTVVGVAVMAVVRLKVCLPADGLFAVAIICVCICTINRIPKSFIGRVVSGFGDCEFELYLLHPAAFGLVSGVAFTRGIYRKLFLIAFATCIAYGWKQLKKQKFFLPLGEKNNEKELMKHERNHTGRRSGNETVSADDGNLEAAAARVR